MNRISRLLPASGLPPISPRLLPALLAPLFLAVLAVRPEIAHSTPIVPPDFVVEDIAPGAGFQYPTCIAPLPDGRILVGEKRGEVWIVKNGVKNPTPLWQADAEILDSYDRGLLSVAVDPNYFVNHYVYFLYTVDPDSNNVEDNIESFGRLTRYTVNFTDSSTVIASSRTILMGVDWPNGPLEASGSHTVGKAVFGTDGSLLISVGDGSDFTVGPDAGGLQPDAFLPGRTDPSEDIGSYRAQYIRSLDGKVLRINPANGHGYPSNPFYDGDETSVRSRVWAYGFRNPFRFTVRPGSGSTDPADGNPGAIYIGDVGWNDWEEWDVITEGGFNAGWPCYEGPIQQLDYWPLTPTHSGCDSIGITPDDPNPASLPIADWHHRLDYAGNPPGFIGNASVGGVFYSDTLYPTAYRGRYFHGDYGQSWIRMATMTPQNAWTSFDLFGSDMDGPVDFAIEPGTGNILYSSIFTGEIRRIRYTGAVGGNSAPIAVATGFPASGPAPLDVQFDGSGSYDPDADPITHTWLFGDGQGSTEVSPAHTYTQAGSYLAILVVADNHGAEARDTIPVLVSPLTMFPSTPVLDDFNRANGALGAPWTADVAGLEVQNNELVQTSGYGFPIWDGAVFGPDQEAYVTIQTIAGNPAPERDLVLKAQGTTSSVAHIEIRYDAQFNQIDVGTYDPGNGWLSQGDPIPATFVAGDQLGCRTYSNGQLEVYQNGTKIATRTLVGWPYITSGGRVGLTLDMVNEGSLDDFGGGDVVFAVNHPPVATILMPPDSSFYVAPDTVHVLATATDQEDPVDSLKFHWDVRLHHNNHMHQALLFDSTAASFVSLDHDDGSGVYYEVLMIVTDTGGLKDTARVNLFPEADLSPSAIATNADHLDPAGETEYTFFIRNTGRMLAHISHWALRADDVALAVGDTIVMPLDSVNVHVIVPGGTLATGDHTLRAVVDSLGTLVETDENNNVVVQDLLVPGGTTAVGDTPGRLELSRPRPNPTRGNVELALELPTAAPVSFEVLDVQGRVALFRPATPLAAGRWSFRWDGRLADGSPAPAGVYLARIQAGSQVMVRRIALLR